MNDTSHFINSEGLKFFGKVNASISHELKNILAIISETSGFLNDLTDLAKQGKELKLSLLESCNDSISEEIQRGFDTIKQMNKFAHSVDIPVKEVDLMETLNLTIALSGFLSTAGKVNLKTSQEPISPVMTSPFLLQDLIYRLLLFLYQSPGTENNVDIKLVPHNTHGVYLKFLVPTRETWDGFPTEKIQRIADVLGIEFGKTVSSTSLDLWIPYVSNGIVALAKELESGI
jgi:light-regulated signal transduction histidine kinase (bacteriophytochrome)